MARVKTKLAILDAAEQLFVEHGFDNTSLRLITESAKVNLAAVNYHFGSKEALIQAVLDRYFCVFVPALTERLTQLSRDSAQMRATDFFTAFAQPLLSLNQVVDNGTTHFMMLVGRGYSESQGHLRRYFTENYGSLLTLIMVCIQRVLPQFDRASLFWRLHYTLGSVVFTMNAWPALLDIANTDFDQPRTIEELINDLIPFLAAAISADSRLPPSYITE